MGNKILKGTIYGVKKSLNILVGVPLAFAFTMVVLSICLVDLILLLLPVALIVSRAFQELNIIVPSSFTLQLISVIIGTGIGYYLYTILKKYVPRYFKGVEGYFKESFNFDI